MSYEEIENINADIESLENSIDKRLLPLTTIITKKGKLKGELSHLTKAQYRRFMGRYPRPSIMENGKVPWHLALDELATERGYKSDEALKEAIEKTVKDKIKLDEMKRKRNMITTDIKDKAVERVNSDDTFKAPVFPPGEKVKSNYASIGDTEVLSRRNPSFHQVEVDYKSTPKEPDYTYRVRYSADAKKLTNVAVKDEKTRILSSSRIRRSKGQGRISPKMPRLR